MDTQELIRFLDVIVWPFVVLFIVVVGKDRIPALLNRVSSIEVGSVKAEFQAGLKELEQITEKASSASNINAYDSKALQLQQLAEMSPNGAVVDSWREVELATISAALHNHLIVRGPRGRVSGNAAMSELSKENVIDESIEGIYKKLKSLRDKAVRYDTQVSVNQAKEYTLTALELAAQLREIKGNIT